MSEDILNLPFIERLHNKDYRYASMIDDVTGKLIHLIDQLRMYKPLLDRQTLEKNALEMERYVLDLARSQYGWNEKQKPLELSFDITPPPECKIHVDLRGPLGAYVAARLSQTFDPTHRIIPLSEPEDPGVVEELPDIDLDEETDVDPRGLNLGFKLSR